MALGKADITPKAQRDEIGPVPVFDDTVFVRRITVQERNDYSAPWLEAAVSGKEANVADIMESRVQLVFHACVDASGNQLFDKIEQVKAWPPEAVDYISNEVARLNGLTKEGRNEIAGN